MTELLPYSGASRSRTTTGLDSCGVRARQSFLAFWHAGLFIWECMQAYPARLPDISQMSLQAPWLLMIETDYVWLKPLIAPPAEAPLSRAQAFPFGYIVPQVAHAPALC